MRADEGQAKSYARIASWALVLCFAGACGRIGVEAVTGPVAEDGGGDPDEPDAGEPEQPDAGDMDAAEPEDSAVDNANDSEAPDAGPADASAAADTGVDAGSADAGDLALRYDFSGTGTVVTDRVGTNNGQIQGGAQLDGNGGLVLDGTNDYVNMPNGLISGYASVTVMAWLTWNGGPCWQRVFDFGSSSNGENNAGDATSAFSLSPASCPNRVVTALFELNGGLRAVNGSALSVGSAAQVALAFDNARGVITLFINGSMAGETTVAWQLSQITDVNNWIGRSQWMQDDYLSARVDELRIYRRALTAAEVMNFYMRGPNAP